MPTYEETRVLIDSLLPDNAEQLISEQDLRTVAHAINDRTNPSDTDNLDIEWAADTTYAADDLVTYLDRIWKSKAGSNTGNTPPSDPLTTESTWWIEQSRAEASAIRDWAAGVYGTGLIIVHYDNALYKLAVGTRPYNSTDIVAEIAAGDWVAISGQGGEGLSVSLRVRSATLLTIDAATQVAVGPSAPGSAKVLEVVSLVVKGNASGGYNQDVQLRYQGESETIAVLPITNTESKYYTIYPGTVATAGNKRLELYAPSAVSGGTNDMDVVINYRIVDFNSLVEV